MDKDTMISFDTFIRTINHFIEIGGFEDSGVSRNRQLTSEQIKELKERTL